MGVKVTADNLDQETFKNSLCIAIRSKVLFPDFLNIADLSYFETKKTARKYEILKNGAL